MEGSRLAAFVEFCEERTGGQIGGARAFEAFSIEQYRRFWLLFLEWSQLRVEGNPEPVCTSDVCEQATFFGDLRVNYAENLLAIDHDRHGEKHAVVAHRFDGTVERVTRRDLRTRVLSLAQHLGELGIGPGDRVAAVVANNPEAIVAALASAAVGAMFCSAAPDMGASALLSRFQQVAPSVLMAGLHDLGDASGTAAERVATLVRELPSLRTMIALDDAAAPPSLSVPLQRLSAILGSDAAQEPHWTRFAFNHPLFVMFTSGTTGKPKCIVHGAGGTLLEHAKEHMLHVDLRRDDTLFFQTSTGWMMWNWQLSALGCGSTIVLYEGAIREPRALWEVVHTEGVSVFGTSPAYLQLCQDADVRPRAEFAMPRLRSILSTGSILHDWQYDWVREHVGDMPLQSISGGTDIIGCFLLGHPDLPVRRGMLQSRSLGLDVRALSAPRERVGELICANPFPSRPLGFLGDEDGCRFHEAYFAANEGVWTHGDLVEFDDDGYARLHGRSDGILNVQGVRIGPAEIHTALHDVLEVKESLAVAQRTPGDREDSRVVLLVVLAAGFTLDRELTRKIMRGIARNASPLHVPRLIVAVSQLPTTHSGKRSERAARDAVNGDPVINRQALRNPQSIDEIHDAVLSAQQRAAADLETADEHGEQTAEGRLRAIIASVLGVGAIEPDDDFFDVGGTSLAAVRVFARVHEQLGVNLPLSTLLSATTPREIAAILDGPGAGRSQVVTLAAGTAGQPVFLLPWWSGEILQFRELVARMHTARSILGVVTAPPDADLAPQRRLPEMADRCLALVRSAQPHGPYALVGHSYGGLLALEVARHLIEQGEAVERLVLIDTAIHERWHSRSDRHRNHLRSFRHAPLAEVLRYARVLAGYVRTSEDVRDLMRRVRGLTPQRSPERTMYLLGHDAYAAHNPEPYPGVVTLLKATWQAGPNDSVPAWRQLARGGLEIVPLPGGHLDALEPPFVDIVATTLSALLDLPRDGVASVASTSAGRPASAPDTAANSAPHAIQSRPRPARSPHGPLEERRPSSSRRDSRRPPRRLS